MKISEQMKAGQGFGGTQRQAHSTTPEGGSDLALTLASTIQSQADQLALAAQAAQVSIDHASDQLSDHFAGVLGGTELIGQTLAKTAAKIEQRGGMVTINTEVAPITLNLPQSGDFGSTRQRFLGLFGGNTADIDPSYILSGPTAEPSSDGEHDD